MILYMSIDPWIKPCIAPPPPFYQWHKYRDVLYCSIMKWYNYSNHRGMEDITAQCNNPWHLNKFQNSFLHCLLNILQILVNRVEFNLLYCETCLNRNTCFPPPPSTNRKKTHDITTITVDIKWIFKLTLSEFFVQFGNVCIILVRSWH